MSYVWGTIKMKKLSRNILIYIITFIVASLVIKKGKIDFEIAIVGCVSYIVTTLIILKLNGE